jgi:TetR/AcrR family transcriptional regulator, regulator of autoinduction and epiphytic fitness
VATLLFSRYGYKKTSVELLAAEASVAKPTIYAYFADKGALFVAVCDKLMGDILAKARAARDAETLEERVFGMLSAKFTSIFELVHTSPHAGELLDSKDALARRVFAKGDAAFLDLLIAEIELAERAKELALREAELDPPRFAALLLHAGHGAAHGVAAVDQQRRALRALVRTLLRGAGHQVALGRGHPPAQARRARRDPARGPGRSR